MAAYTQTGRYLSATTPLGKDVLLLTAFEGDEELSRLFTYRLEFLSTNEALDPKAIIGKSVNWAVQPAGGQPRYFNGLVRSFSAGGKQVRQVRAYRAEVVPWLWLLTQTSDCRIFQNKKPPDIIKQVFDDLGLRDVQISLRGDYPALDYCVQYRETDFDFVSRLMEEFGIFYFFKHTADKHMLVLADDKSAYADCPEKQAVYDPSTMGVRQDHFLGARVQHPLRQMGADRLQLRDTLCQPGDQQRYADQGRRQRQARGL